MIKAIALDDLITGKVRKNEVVAYVYEQLVGRELFKDTHGYY